MNRSRFFVHKNGGSVAKVQSAPDGIAFPELADFLEVCLRLNGHALDGRFSAGKTRNSLGKRRMNDE